MPTTLPPSEQQLQDSMTAYDLFIEAFRDQLPFTCVMTFKGSTNADHTAPAYPLMKFRIELSEMASKEIDWFESFIEVWNHKQIIEWQFQRQPAHPSDSRTLCHYILAPKCTNGLRDLWFVIRARHAGAQLGAFFIAWKYGLLHETAKLH